MQEDDNCKQEPTIADVSEKSIDREISLVANQIIPENIDSLNLTRDKNIQIIIEKRDDFINEISNFFNSDDVILKIYGCDGIGKSLSFVYLQSLCALRNVSN